MLDVSGGVLAQEPCDEVSEHDSLVRLVVVGGRWNSSEIPEIPLPFVEFVILAAGVKEEHSRCTLDEPAAVESLDAPFSHCGQSFDHVRVGGLVGLYLHGGRFVGEWSDKTVSIAILFHGDWDLCLYHGIYSSNLVHFSSVFGAKKTGRKLQAACTLFATSQAHSKRRGFLTSRFTTDMNEEEWGYWEEEGTK